MTVQVLSDLNKEEIARLFTKNGFNQTELASTFSVSTRTIRRVLDEKGVGPVSESAAILAVVKAFGHTAESLRTKLEEPTLDAKSVREFLIATPEHILVAMFDSVYKARAREFMKKNFNQHPSKYDQIATE